MQSKEFDDKFLKVHIATKNLSEFDLLMLFSKVLSHRCKKAGGPLFEVAKCAFYTAETLKVGRKTLCETE